MIFPVCYDMLLSATLNKRTLADPAPYRPSTQQKFWPTSSVFGHLV